MTGEREEYSEREFKLGQLAAFVDGEGTIGIEKSRAKKNDSRKNDSYSLKLSVTNTAIELIDWLQEKFGGNVRKQRKEGRKLCYEWKIQGREAYILLKEMSFFLIIKKEQADTAIKFWYETQRGGYRGMGQKPLWKIKRREKYYQKLKNNASLKSEAPCDSWGEGNSRFRNNGR